MFENPATGKKLYEEVVQKSMNWGNENNTMYVVGATRADMISRIREIAPEHFFLVPGVGEQGGNLEQVAKNGMNHRCGLLVNSSRGIIYADNTIRFAGAARAAAMLLQKEMNELLTQAHLV